jgi:hypothetical protein
LQTAIHVTAINKLAAAQKEAPPDGQTETAHEGKLTMHHVRHRVREDKHYQPSLFIGADEELRIRAARRSAWRAWACYCGIVESASAAIVETNVTLPASAATSRRCDQ